MDSHMTALVLVDECNEAVETLAKSIQKHVDICVALTPLEG